MVPDARIGWCILVLICLDSVARGVEAEPASRPASQPSSQPVGELIIEGQVVDHIGAGVKGVEVTVLRGTGERLEDIGTATSDEMGDFKLYGPKRILGKLLVRFDKAGYKPHEVEVESIADELPPFVDYQLGGALSLTGSARDALKNVPIAGARVAVRSYADEKSARTDDTGKFEIAELLPGKMRLIVEAEGFARHQQDVEIAGDTEPVNVRLDPERVVRLQVIDDAGTPISGVVVEALASEDGDYRTVPTDSEGRATLRGLGMAMPDLSVRLFHADFVSSRSFDRVIELPPDRPESSHTLTMARAAVISGKVLAAESGRPLGGARLTVGDSLEEAAATGYSNLDGTFTITGVPPGEAVVTAHLAEHAPAMSVVTVQPGKPAELTLMLSPAAEVRGSIIDPDGQPVPGAQVAAAQWKGRRTLGLRAMTDEEGRFTIRDAPPDEFIVDVYAVGFKPLRNQPVRPGAGDQLLKFTEARSTAATPSGGGPKEGEESPPFELTTLDGQKLRPADLKGQWVLLDFWATWCGPCVAEVPALVALHKEFGGWRDFIMVGISLDMDEAALRRFIKDRKIAWAQVFGDGGGSTRAAEQFGIMGIPMTYLIGPDGRIAAKGLRGEQIAVELRKRLGETKRE